MMMMMKPQSTRIHFLQLSFLLLLFFTLLLHATLSYTPRLLPATTLVLLLLLLLRRRRRPVLLLNYSCYKPPPNLKCSREAAHDFVRRRIPNPKSVDFMSNISSKSGLGEETYGPSFMFQGKPAATFANAVDEAQDGMFSAIDSLLFKTQLNVDLIDVVIVTSGSFSPAPSLSSRIVNRYKLKPDVKTFNLSGMGCSSGVAAFDLAARVLSVGKKVQYALLIITEGISSNWYFGDNRSMLVTNCIFRVGCAAAVLTNDPSRRRVAKMELVDSLRTHHGADEGSYRAAFQEEDDKGITGFSLTKDLVRVAGTNLREHIKILAPRVLPLSQLVRYCYSAAVSRGGSKPAPPDFRTAFEHMCVHTGGKAVIEQVGRVLRLGDEVTEPARMTLHRFGNTSSSLVLYELAYFEAKGVVRSGDRMWMIAFGTGFKIGSLVWRWLCDSTEDCDNPWNDCIQSYPVN
ncbi:3-ketoacyl-CoA synthase 4-like [Diospyros lotus]|uniref:3-ketoacyl-CoA synthase 4-like n=1 Tax=Diospyros lotus TaxID=55363 RepID=UPI0022587960|nr:3-ketoacyl-CoA synthase 4-like [Diospyros lotus]